MIFPEGFAFYHLGNVEKKIETRAESAQASFADQVGVSFNIYGEAISLIVLLFDRSLDISTYSEMGNVLASRMAAQLGNNSGLETMISPPRFLTTEQLRGQISPVLSALEKAGISVPIQEYAHHYGETSVSLQLLMIPGNQDQALEQRIFS